MSTMSQPPVEPKPPAQRTPEQLAARAAEGSLESYGELVKRFEVRLFNFLLRKTGSRSDAEDLTQEAFIRAWEKIKRYDPKWRFSTWLFTIAARLAVSHHRKRRAGPRWADQVDVGVDIGPGADRAEDRMNGARLWKMAERVLGHEQHTALWLRYAEDMNIGEIAKVLGKSQVGVRVMLFRARQVLAQQVEKEQEQNAAGADGRAGLGTGIGGAAFIGNRPGGLAGSMA